MRRGNALLRLRYQQLVDRDDDLLVVVRPLRRARDPGERLLVRVRPVQLLSLVVKHGVDALLRAYSGLGTADRRIGGGGQSMHEGKRIARS